MIATRRVNALVRNPGFRNVPRIGPREHRNNLAWLERAVPDDSKRLEILLLGGRRPTDFRLRVAQAQLRHDLTPSHWSHVCFLGARKAAAPGDTATFEISLEPPGGFGFAPPTNGVQIGRLERYRDARAWPNVALIELPLASGALDEQALAVIRDRTALDALELVLRWLAFVWGVGRAGNPLLDGAGIPSAVLVETLLAAAGFEITPSVPARLSCPETIWQAASWWHDYYKRTARPNTRGAGVVGAWHVGDVLGVLGDGVE